MWSISATRFLLLLCVAIGLEVEANDYCSIASCENPKEHVMCLYKEDKLSPDCTNYQKDLEFSEEEKMAILRAHNNLRSAVATGYPVARYVTRQYPGLNGAQDMQVMVWDTELEMFARRWVRQCQGGAKDKCRDTAKHPNVGQLVFKGDWDPSLPVSHHINLAYVDAGPSTMDYPIDVSQAETLATEEQRVLAQLLWANAERLGCARSVFDNKTSRAVPGSFGRMEGGAVTTTTPSPWMGKSNKASYVIVCDYSDGEQMKGPIYKSGRPCVFCSCSSEYSGLCASAEGLRASSLFLAIYTTLVVTLAAS